ncbi:hypothetical protein SDC9_82491 [bioreactor metagenome]|uniref:Uncharacterized protein n=1 Tax=bioreactor metagenome TaxID=1076179 RepID=A0A644Z5K4_9ZZZZ
MRGLEQHREETPPKKTRVVLFGCSKKAEHLSSITPPFPIDYFVDDDSALWGTVFAGLPVRPPSALLEEYPAGTTVFIASPDYQTTFERLMGMGFGDTSVMPL